MPHAGDAAADARIMGDPAIHSGQLQLPYTDEDVRRTRLTDQCAPGKLDFPKIATAAPRT